MKGVYVNLDIKSLKKIQNVDVNSPAYPSFKKMVIDLADGINKILVELLKKENNYEKN
tara:strand:- start:1501 stop:1674 length:174 start_codon:yes stop_codon:yes gene_type:complete